MVNQACSHSCQSALCLPGKIMCTHKKKEKLQHVVEQRLYFAWSNLIDGEHVPQVLLRSEEPPGSYIWKASVYFQDANVAHLKGYKLQRTHNVNVLECSAGGRGCLRTPLMSGSGSLPLTHPSPASHTHACLKRKAAAERLSSRQNHVYPFCSFIYKGLMEHIYTRCAGDSEATCASRGQALREPEETMPDLLPLPSPHSSPFWHPSLSSSERLQGLGGWGWEG